MNPYRSSRSTVRSAPERGPWRIASRRSSVSDSSTVALSIVSSPRRPARGAYRSRTTTPLARLAGSLDIGFVPGDPATGSVRTLLDGVDVTNEIRTEQCGNDASRVSASARVRDALLARQQGFRRPPGLVADGRDMGTVVFPDAPVKVFLTATAQTRAERRYKQLMAKGIDVSVTRLSREMAERDRRDRERVVAPLKPADDAVVVDSTGLNVDTVVARVLEIARSRMTATSSGE